VLGDGGDKLARGEDLEIALDLGSRYSPNVWMHMTMPGRPSGWFKAVCMYSNRLSWAMRQ
jgi:hypothetical protein